MGFIHVRYDEVGLKGANRPFFEKKLRKNLARQLQLEGGSVSRVRGRIVVDTGARDARSVLPVVARVFGVASAAPVIIVPREEARIYETAVELAREAVAQGKRRFRVEARRADKSFPVSSVEVAKRAGAAVVVALGDKVKVDLHDPEFRIGVEVRREGAALHAVETPGPGGVPAGVAGRALVLLSGGIDSPVAAWYALKRGLHADFVYFHAFPYVGDRTKEKVLSIAREVSRWAPDPVFGWVVPFAKVQDAIAAAGDMELRTVILRRFMYRVAEKIAELRGHKALVTGEALGQVASQTPENLRCVEVVVPGTLVLRPLLGFDKYEVIARAKAIGTYETSILPYDDCCSLFAPRHPATKATPEKCEELEARLDVAELVAEAVAGAETWKVLRGDAPVKLQDGIRPTKKRESASSADAPPRGAAFGAAGPGPPPGPREPRARDEDDVLHTDFSEG